MTLQASGAITLTNIQTEFGGGDPISISEYYAAANPVLVPAGTTDGAGNAIPTSNDISMSHFHDTAQVWTLTQGIYNVPSSDNTYRGYIASGTSAIGSISSTNYSGVTINTAYMHVDPGPYFTIRAILVNMTGTLDKDFFTTFTGGGHTLASSASIHLQSGGTTQWTWQGLDSAFPVNDWDGSGDLTVTIT